MNDDGEADQPVGGSDEPILTDAVSYATNNYAEIPRLDEATLSIALRNAVHMEKSFRDDLLGILADALDNPEAEYRLHIVRNRRGRPARSNSDVDRGRAYYVGWRMQSEGIPLKAAVADAMSAYGCSRATVFRSLKRHRVLKERAAELAMRAMPARKSQ